MTDEAKSSPKHRELRLDCLREANKSAEQLVFSNGDRGDGVVKIADQYYQFVKDGTTPSSE